MLTSPAILNDAITNEFNGAQLVKLKRKKAYSSHATAIKLIDTNRLVFARQLLFSRQRKDAKVCFVLFLVLVFLLVGVCVCVWVWVCGCTCVCFFFFYFLFPVAVPYWATFGDKKIQVN